jgi:transposase-like protein
MMLALDSAGGLDDQVIELIAARVADALQDNLAAIAAELSLPPAAREQLTVGQVAQRLGVTRSTVYAHWREWGGYKLGTGPRAPIRFDSSALPIERRHPPTKPPELTSGTRTGGRRRGQPRRDLLQDAPRLAASPHR